MRMILRNRKTGHFFQGVSDWTDRVTNAYDFQCPERVVRFVLAAGLNIKDMELVLAFKDSRYNIDLPLDERWGFRLPESKEPVKPESVKTAQPWSIPAALPSSGVTDGQRSYL